MSWNNNYNYYNNYKILIIKLYLKVNLYIHLYPGGWKANCFICRCLPVPAPPLWLPVAAPAICQCCHLGNYCPVPILSRMLLLKKESHWQRRTLFLFLYQPLDTTGSRHLLILCAHNNLNSKHICVIYSFVIIVSQYIVSFLLFSNRPAYRGCSYQGDLTKPMISDRDTVHGTGRPDVWCSMWIILN